MKLTIKTGSAWLYLSITLTTIYLFACPQIVYAERGANATGHFETLVIPGEVDLKALKKTLAAEKKAAKSAAKANKKATKKAAKAEKKALKKAKNSSNNALILYDAPPAAPAGKLGLAYSIMLKNLLGHFEADVTLQPVDEYLQGDIDPYSTIFYLGSYFDNPIPAAFLSDVANTDKTVVWFKYNIWQLAGNMGPGFSQKYGFDYSNLRGLNDAPSTLNPNPGFFDTVQYKGKSLVKFYDFDISSQTIIADPDVGTVTVMDPNKANALVNISNSRTAEQIPYITRGGNFWYVADMPFSFIGPRDRYLVISDILHDMLGINHAENHRAMVRLEDVGALVNGDAMKTLADYLYNKNIPFSIATIPFYSDPLGKYNDGIAQETHLSAARQLLDSLDYATKQGGTVVMHGYTHQYNSIANPYFGTSGDDFEFWNVVNNSPVAEDSVLWADNRLKAGLDEFRANGFKPTIWVTPHYQASENSHKAIASRFDSRYERSFYYTAVTPQLNLASSDPERDFSVGQFFPYIIAADYYGQRVLPENLGNIEYDIRSIDPTSYITYTADDLLTNAEYALLVRDGFASFFFHPFWLQPELPITTGFQDFSRVVEGISRLGYTWTEANKISK